MKSLSVVIFYFYVAFTYGQTSVVLSDERDKQKYQTVVIGNQIWMAENLRFEYKSESWCYENKKVNCVKFGRLYTWVAAMQSCPVGWKLPDEKDWEELELFLGLEKKEIKETGWRGENVSGKLRETGSTGFNAKFCGFRHISGKFYELNHGTGFWSSSMGKDDDAFRRFINIENTGIDKDKEDMGTGFSVRCIQSNKKK